MKDNIFREIATIVRETDYFQVFNDLLVDVIERVRMVRIIH